MQHLTASSLALACAATALLAGVGAGGTASAAPAASSVAAPEGARGVLARDDARSALRAHAPLGARDALVATDTVLDPDGESHVRFERTYDGLEVVGGDVVVHQGAGSRFRSVSGAAPALDLATRPTLPAAAAADRARDVVSARRERSTTPELVVLAVGTAPRLAWRVEVLGRGADGQPVGELVFVAARGTAGVLGHWPSVLSSTGSGESLYSGTVPLDTRRRTGGGFVMVDPTRGGNATYNGHATKAPLFRDADNRWGTGEQDAPQTAGVDAHHGIATTWDYYLSTFDRKGIRDDGKGARSFVHDGRYVNASWGDRCFCMRYGDGNGRRFGPLVALDIAAHEMTHGVTADTAKLIYRREAGGLNEATSDILGTSVEFYAANSQDVPDYVIGEEIYRPYDPTRNYLRRMDKPSRDGRSQDCRTARTKYKDPHFSSGPANHFFYLLSEGSGTRTINGIRYHSPTCDGSSVTGIGHEAAARIWYRALTVYMTSRTTYAGARRATVSAARDLFEPGSTEVAAVQAAWSAVDVG